MGGCLAFVVPGCALWQRTSARRPPVPWGSDPGVDLAKADVTPVWCLSPGTRDLRLLRAPDHFSPVAARNNLQSKRGPGSVLRPGAMSLWPTACRIG